MRSHKLPPNLVRSASTASTLTTMTILNKSHLPKMPLTTLFRPVPNINIVHVLIWSTVAPPQPTSSNIQTSQKIVCCSEILGTRRLVTGDQLLVLDSYKWYTWFHTNQSSPPKGAEIVPSGFTFKINIDSYGKLARHKSLLVSQGKFHEFVPCHAQIYAPVFSEEIFRPIMSIYVLNKCAISQIVYKTAFSHATLPEKDNIWVRLPLLNA